MSRIPSKFSVISTLILLSLIAPSSQEEEEYIAPSSAQFPFGDEVLNDDINETHVQQTFVPLDIETIHDIYTFCPNKTEEEYEDPPYSENECLKCDIRARYDKTGAIVECFGCTNINSLAESQEGPTILFLAFHLEIPEYALQELDEAPPEPSVLPVTA